LFILHQHSEVVYFPHFHLKYLCPNSSQSSEQIILLPSQISIFFFTQVSFIILSASLYSTILIVIIGSRDLDEDFVVDKLINILSSIEKVSIISGGARGVDTYVSQCCETMSIPIKIIKPINPSNKLDYLFRNVEIITLADKIIAFWDGKSKGTKFVIDYATARGKEVEVIRK
ncbi:unnamed protein product, partial [marine sediment metagenome]